MSIMKPQLFLLYLLSSYGPNFVTATSEAEEEHEVVVGPALPPLKLGMSVCAFKADSGPCKALHTRYHFDIKTRQCEIFNYGGCEGNENNFQTLEECQEKCIIPDLPEKKKQSKLIKGKPFHCLLENDPGICRGLLVRYFYNRESQMCEKFQYGGCLGNANNFLTLKECQDTCEDNSLPGNSLQIVNEITAFNETSNRTPVRKHELVLLPSLCMMHMDKGLCRASEKRYFYNYTTGKCHPFSYSGCGGNENNFTSRKSCLQMCKKGFIKKRGQRGVMKIQKNRRKQRIRQMDEEIVIERI